MKIKSAKEKSTNKALSIKIFIYVFLDCQKYTKIYRWLAFCQVSIYYAFSDLHFLSQGHNFEEITSHIYKHELYFK